MDLTAIRLGQRIRRSANEAQAKAGPSPYKSGRPNCGVARASSYADQEVSEQRRLRLTCGTADSHESPRRSGVTNSSMALAQGRFRKRLHFSRRNNIRRCHAPTGRLPISLATRLTGALS
jgi:hypothetical protein